MMLSRWWLPCTLFATASWLATEAHADVRVFNYDNRPIFVSAGCHVAGNKVDYNGWKRVMPGESVLVYVGNESQILLSVNNDGDPNVRHIGNNRGIREYWSIGDRFDVLDQGGPNHLLRLRWGPNLENQYFMDDNNGPPPGWSKRKFYIVPNNVNQEFIP